MIPRLKPYFGSEEIVAVFSPYNGAVAEFERSFARLFEAKYALAFPYGRSGLYVLFKALDIEKAEVIIPAYTCVVVAHATVLSGNLLRFVDISLEDYNMDLDRVEKAINENTKAILATHIFGYPLNTERLKEIVGQRDILIIHDCAHSFGARFEGKYVCNEGAAAIFGLNISKQISSVFGGMVTTNDEAIYTRLKTYRDEHFTKPSPFKQLRKLAYFLTTYPTFAQTLYGLVSFLEEDTSLLDAFTRYYRDDRIDMPSDSLEFLGKLEARVGLAQLEKYAEISERRREIAHFYDEHLRDLAGIELPPLVEGATYSHYVPRVKDRVAVMGGMKRYGVQLGQLIEYSIPHMAAYRPYVSDRDEFQNSYLCSKTTINLPNYPALTQDDLIYIVERLRAVVRDLGGI